MGHAVIPWIKCMEANFDFADFYSRHRPNLQRLAAAWFGRESDDADEAVQETFIFALENRNLVPNAEREAGNWLVAVLRFRVLRIKSSRFVRSRRFPNERHARFCFVPIYDRGGSGSNGHCLVESAEDHRGTGDYDDLISGLTLEQRESLFTEWGGGADISWAEHRQRAELRSALQPTLPPLNLSASTRILDFVRQHAASRSLTHVQDYLSQFRVLQRRFGRTLRLSDLTRDFYDRFVSPLSNGSRKRVMAIWNAAARTGVIHGPPRKGKYPPMPHPATWPSDKLERFLIGAGGLEGVVRGTAVLHSEFWTAIVSVAADSGLSYSALLPLTWPEFRVRDAVMAKMTARTVDCLQRLERHGCQHVFPWRPRDLFYKHYSKVLRITGITAGSLTERERAVLLGTAAGLTEGELAARFDCCKGVVVEYRRRLREKLGLRANTSLKALVLTAKERGLLPDDVNTDEANDHVYSRKR